MSNFELWVGKLAPVDLNGKSRAEWFRELPDKPNFVENFLLVEFDGMYYQKIFSNEETGILYEITQTQLYINHQNPELIIGENANFDKHNYLRFTKNKDDSFDFVTSFYRGGSSFYKGAQSLEEMFNEHFFAR